MTGITPYRTLHAISRPLPARDEIEASSEGIEYLFADTAADGQERSH
ncbi:MAG: hypothetical protein H6R08_1575 [Proteobacteria bacterium]|jgi:hypothetical protein|nr:hypothetical protein [Pseudomonadota bacterium]